MVICRSKIRILTMTATYTCTLCNCYITVCNCYITVKLAVFTLTKNLIAENSVLCYFADPNMSYVNPDDDPALHRLEGSMGDVKGGLVIMKKGPANDNDKHTFKKPSLLGLDKLAASKRSADVDNGGMIKKSRVTSYKDNDDFNSSSGSNSDSSDEEREKKSSNRRDRSVKNVLFFFKFKRMYAFSYQVCYKTTRKRKETKNKIYKFTAYNAKFIKWIWIGMNLELAFVIFKNIYRNFWVASSIEPALMPQMCELSWFCTGSKTLLLNGTIVYKDLIY